MARVKAGVFGNAYSGKAGNMVFSTLNGEQIVRAYQPNVENPRTPLQSAQRERFSLVVTGAKLVRASLGRFYGTRRIQNFGTITKTFLSSPLVKGYLGLTNKMTGVANAVVFGKDELKNTGNLIETYQPSGLNILQGGVTIKFGDVATLTEGTQNACSILELKDGVWANLEESSNILYFGCDYKLGNSIDFAVILRAAADTRVTSRPYISIMSASEGFGIKDIQSVPQTSPSGYRRRGYYSNADACGSGWNYIYKCTRKVTFATPEGDSAVNEQHAIFTKNGKRVTGYLPSLSFIAFTSNIENDPCIVPIHAETMVGFDDAVIQ